MTSDMTHPYIRVAVDIGGTFTDIEILNEKTGAIHQFKTPSTPSDPSTGLLSGIRAASERFGFPIEAIGQLMHGTTIATNAVLERKLAAGALITTVGFEDVLQIGRHGRRDVYAVTSEPAVALIPRRLCLGVKERIDARGQVTVELDVDSVSAVANQLRKAEVQTVAICLINAYTNPQHERRVREILANALPGITISLSSDISPEIREYERMSTTVLNALLVPIVARYTKRLAERLTTEAPGMQVYLVQSNGGVSGLAKAGREPARLLLSGPSGGAAAARRLSAELKEPNLVAVDMGGTSFDVSVVHKGSISMVNEGEVDGLPVRLPMVEMRTIGAGGGSIAWIDAGNRLRIGPQSAGAVPGPACYGKGGKQLTVTDANLLLGRLDAARFMGGAMPLDIDASTSAVAELSAGLKLNLDETAAGVIAVTNSALSMAIRLSLFEKGLDPEEFAILSFGGAGGVHACEVAEELGITRVIFPPHASTLSAWGILWSDITHDLSATQIMPLVEAHIPLKATAEQLEKDALRLLEEDGVAPAQRRLTWSLDLRYRGQAFDLGVPLDGADFSAAGLAKAAEAFHALHRQRFSYDEPTVPIEVVALRLSAIGQLAKPVEHATTASATATVKQGNRPVWGCGQFLETAVWHADNLAPDACVDGPAVIEEAYTSTYLPSGWQLRRHVTGSLIATHTEIKECRK